LLSHVATFSGESTTILQLGFILSMVE
jgi:hypothetical protein